MERNQADIRIDEGSFDIDQEQINPLTSSQSSYNASESNQILDTSQNSYQSRPSNIIKEQPEKAINLITYDQKEGFQVSQDAIDLLKNIKEKIGVIAVAGKYRTGKSFLLNRIILNKKDSNGFGVGPTINPCTKGLWIWNKPIEIESRVGEPPFKVFIIDSEGIGAFNEDQNHDTRIFLLALLLSSYFVYNSMGTIDENALQNLSLIVNLSKQLQIKNQKAEEADPEDVAKYFPSFLWVVRDFALKLLDQYGNQINSKEYLENSLKEQKGTSDNIEKKNKIRRLILNFFKDRDCYTMVRPTEEEKDLQTLQKMDDEKLRPEFIEQMTILRARIFKRVKPKVLNGRFITGEMFLELCQAYTTAINKGSVPCIESAWTYLCQNECQRAIQESIQHYEKEISQKIFLNLKKTDCINYPEVKSLHKSLREESLLYFKEKAVGQNLKEFESKILDEITKKYVQIKQKCMHIYEQKCQSLIWKDVENMESMIRQDLYASIPDFNQDLEKLKQSFASLTQTITYSQKESVIRSICERLIMKGYEAIFRKEKEQLTNQNRQLTEKANYLEKDITAKKQDYDSERNLVQNKLIDLQAEVQNLRANSKISEERNRMLEVERGRLESQLQEKLVLLNEQKDKIENQLSTQLRDYQSRLKISEDQSLKLQIQYEKEQALREQKMAFMERDNSSYTNRIEQLFQENRQLQEKVSLLENQLKQNDQFIKQKEEEKKKEIDMIKDFFQRKIDEGKNFESTVSIEKQRQWEQEKQFLQDQLTFAQKQIDQNKNMHEALLLAINNNRGQEKEQDQQLISVNKNLSETIAKVEQRNQQLQQKVSLIKIFQRVFKHSQSMQCKFCQVFFPSEIFVDHVKSCNKDNRYTRSHFFQIPLSISIQQTRIDVDPVDNRQYTEYVVQVNFNDKTWVVSQKYKSFCQLHEKLINQYPNIKFPQSSFQFSQKTLNEFGNMKSRGTQGGAVGGSSLIEDRRKILQQYLQDLALIPAIKESPHLKSFLDIHLHFPEFCDDIFSVQNQIISQQSDITLATSNTRSGSTLGGNFKIMKDLFQKQQTTVPVAQQQNTQNFIQYQGDLISSQFSQNPSESLIRQQLARKFDCEIEDLIQNKSIAGQEIQKRLDSNLSSLKLSQLQLQQPNTYSQMNTSGQQITPTKVSEQIRQYNQLSSQENLVTDPNMMDEDLSSIEGVLVDDENTRFIQQDEMEMNLVDNDYDEDVYQYNQQPQPSESPLKSSYNQNSQVQSQSRNNQQIYKSVLVNNSNNKNYVQSYQHSNQHANQHIQPQYANQYQLQSINDAGMIKKSTSSNNLMYSPSQIQTSQMTSVLFNDKTNQNLKIISGSMNQLPIMKENCVACHQKQTIDQVDHINNSIERPGSILSYDRQFMTSSHQNFPNMQSFNQTANQEYQITQQKNATLLEELVQKCNSKAQQFGTLAQQRAQAQKQKLESFVTPRDNTGTMLNNLIQNASQNSTQQYIKTEQAMRSDKILQDLLMRDKSTTSAQSSTKRITPVKNSGQKPNITTSNSQYGTSNPQTIRSPFSGKKQSNAGITHQSSINQQFQQMSSNGTPDQAQRRNSMLNSQKQFTNSWKKQQSSTNQNGLGGQSEYDNNSSKKSQTQVSQFDQRSNGGKSSEKIRVNNQYGYNQNL